MLVLRDLNNNDIISNYVAMPDRIQYCSHHVSAVTGVPLKTVQNILRKLELSGVIKRVAKDRKTIYYTRVSGDETDNYLLTKSEAEVVKLSKTLSKNAVIKAMGSTRGKIDVMLQSIRKKGLNVRFYTSAEPPVEATKILTVMQAGEWYQSQQIIFLAGLKYPRACVGEMVRCGLLEERKDKDRKIYYRKVINAEN